MIVQREAKTEADSCGMTNQRTGNDNGGLMDEIPTHDDEACHGWGTRMVVAGGRRPGLKPLYICG
jgi:hypothetical protein